MTSNVFAVDTAKIECVCEDLFPCSEFSEDIVKLKVNSNPAFLKNTANIHFALNFLRI